MNPLQDKRDEISARTLQVRTTSQEIKKWDNQAIVKSLRKETNLSDGILDEIAEKVRLKIKRLKIEHISASLVREMVGV